MSDSIWTAQIYPQVKSRCVNRSGSVETQEFVSKNRCFLHKNLSKLLCIQSTGPERTENPFAKHLKFGDFFKRDPHFWKRISNLRFCVWTRFYDQIGPKPDFGQNWRCRYLRGGRSKNFGFREWWITQNARPESGRNFRSAGRKGSKKCQKGSRGNTSGVLRARMPKPGREHQVLYRYNVN